MPVPNDFDILCPSFVKTVGWIRIVWNGALPINSNPENIILATHKLIISLAVLKTSVG